MQSTMHVYEVRPRKDKRRVDLISSAPHERNATDCEGQWRGAQAKHPRDIGIARPSAAPKPNNEPRGTLRESLALANVNHRII